MSGRYGLQKPFSVTYPTTGSRASDEVWHRTGSLGAADSNADRHRGSKKAAGASVRVDHERE